MLAGGIGTAAPPSTEIESAESVEPTCWPMTSSSTDKSVTCVQLLPGPPSAATALIGIGPVVHDPEPIANARTVVPLGTAGRVPPDVSAPSDKKTSVFVDAAAASDRTVLAAVTPAT